MKKLVTAMMSLVLILTFSSCEKPPAVKLDDSIQIMETTSAGHPYLHDYMGHASMNGDVATYTGQDFSPGARIGLSAPMRNKSEETKKLIITRGIGMCDGCGGTQITSGPTTEERIELAAGKMIRIENFHDVGSDPEPASGRRYKIGTKITDAETGEVYFDRSFQFKN